ISSVRSTHPAGTLHVNPNPTFRYTPAFTEPASRADSEDRAVSEVFALCLLDEEESCASAFGGKMHAPNARTEFSNRNGKENRGRPQLILPCYPRGKPSRRPSHHRLRAMRTPPRLNRNFAQALRTLLRRRIRRLLPSVHAGHQKIHRHHHKEINGRSNQKKRNAGIDKVSDRKVSAAHIKL